MKKPDLVNNLASADVNLSTLTDPGLKIWIEEQQELTDTYIKHRERQAKIEVLNTLRCELSLDPENEVQIVETIKGELKIYYTQAVKWIKKHIDSLEKEGKG
jgi:hypothetical protein